MMTKEERKLLPLVSVLIAVAVILIATASYFALKEKSTPEKVEDTEEITTSAEPTEEPKIKIIGQSVEGRDIESYTYGTGPTTILFVGGIHGGYEWNSSLLAYQFINELDTKRISVPDTLTIKIIPTLNPDGLFKVIGKEGRFTELDATTDIDILSNARFNANDVDLNRNFDCKWQPTSTWRGQVVDAGGNVFSEPEALALKKLVEETNPEAVIFWHSQANAVYASECEEGILPETLALMNTYADSAGYPSVDSFDAYPISGDAEGWLASIGIPAITVELSSRDDLDWFKNKAGFEAVIDYYKTAR